MAKVTATFQVKVVYDTRDWDIPLTVDKVCDQLGESVNPFQGPDVEDVDWSVVRVGIDTD